MTCNLGEVAAESHMGAGFICVWAEDCLCSISQIKLQALWSCYVHCGTTNSTWAATELQQCGQWHWTSPTFFWQNPNIFLLATLTTLNSYHLGTHAAPTGQQLATKKHLSQEPLAGGCCFSVKHVCARYHRFTECWGLKWPWKIT